MHHNIVAMKLGSFSSSSTHVMDRILCEIDDFGAAGHKKIACLPRPAAKFGSEPIRLLEGYLARNAIAAWRPHTPPDAR